MYSNYVADDLYRRSIGEKPSNGFLESCRVNLSRGRQMRKEMLEAFSLRSFSERYQNAYAKFSSETGQLMFFRSRPVTLVYEIPCPRDPFALIPPFVHFSTGVCNSISESICVDYMDEFSKAAHPVFLVNSYKGDCGRFCFTKGDTLDWIYQTGVPEEYRFYKIRQDKFFVDIFGKRVFISPKLEDYQRMIKQGSSYIDNGEDVEYLYDYWDVDKQEDSETANITISYPSRLDEESFS
jgi:hypothetical protein